MVSSTKMEKTLNAFNTGNVSFFENSKCGEAPFVKNLINIWKKWDATNEEEKAKILDNVPTDGIYSK